MSICGKCIHYEICDEYVSPCETFPETDGCPCYKSKDDFAEVKHGEWLLGKYKCMDRSVCSVCNSVYEGGDDWNYCPNCGAKMDGERKEQ